MPTPEEKSERIRQLNRQITYLDGTIKATKEEVTEANDRLSELRKKKQALDKERKALQPQKIHVTDHAVIRYIERHLEVDVDAIRETIGKDIQEVANQVGGNSKLPLSEGGKAVLKDYTVVTIYD